MPNQPSYSEPAPSATTPDPAHFRAVETLDIPLPPVATPNPAGVPSATAPLTINSSATDSQPPPPAVRIDSELQTARPMGDSCELKEKVSDFLAHMLWMEEKSDGLPLSERLAPILIVAGTAAFAYARQRRKKWIRDANFGDQHDDPSWDTRPDLVFLPAVDHP
jgi:hypothetical protein